MSMNVIIPLNDDIRLSVDDYRNKLYEIMASHNVSRLKPPPPRVNNMKLVPDVRPKVAKDTERYIKARCYQSKEKPHNTQSEPKIYHKPKLTHTIIHKSESKLSKQMLHMPMETRIGKAYGDHVQKQTFSSSEISHLNKGKLNKKAMCSKSNVDPHFNSYNQNHGIITQSALMELKASGTR